MESPLCSRLYSPKFSVKHLSIHVNVPHWLLPVWTVATASESYSREPAQRHHQDLGLFLSVSGWGVCVWGHLPAEQGWCKGSENGLLECATDSASQ